MKIIAKNADICALLLSYQIQVLLKSVGERPSYIAEKARINIPEEFNDWDLLDLNNKHFVDNNKNGQAKNKDIQIKLLNYLFEGSDCYLPLLKTSDINDWPILLSCQIHQICLFKNIMPIDLLQSFEILYQGNKENSWDEFPWSQQIQPVYLFVELIDKGYVYEN